MGTVLDRFKENVVGSDLKDWDYLPIIGASGDLVRTKGVETVINSWHNILLTPLGSYDHDPEYGSKLYSYIFAPADNETLSKIKREIEFRLPKYDDRATIINVEIAFLQNKKGFNVIIELLYSGEKSKLSTSINQANVSKFLGVS